MIGGIRMGATSCASTGGGSGRACPSASLDTAGSPVVGCDASAWHAPGSSVLCPVATNACCCACALGSGELLLETLLGPSLSEEPPAFSGCFCVADMSRPCTAPSNYGPRVHAVPDDLMSLVWPFCRTAKRCSAEWPGATYIYVLQQAISRRSLRGARARARAAQAPLPRQGL